MYITHYILSVCYRYDEQFAPGDFPIWPWPSVQSRNPINQFPPHSGPPGALGTNFPVRHHRGVNASTTIFLRIFRARHYWIVSVMTGSSWQIMILFSVQMYLIYCSRHGDPSDANAPTNPTGINMMTLWHGSAFRITSPLWGESTGDRSCDVTVIRMDNTFHNCRGACITKRNLSRKPC